MSLRRKKMSYPVAHWILKERFKPGWQRDDGIHINCLQETTEPLSLIDAVNVFKLAQSIVQDPTIALECWIDFVFKSKTKADHLLWIFPPELYVGRLADNFVENSCKQILGRENSTINKKIDSACANSMVKDYEITTYQCEAQGHETLILVRLHSRFSRVVA